MCAGKTAGPGNGSDCSAAYPPHVVAVGACARSLPALEELLNSIPLDAGFAVVVALHADVKSGQDLIARLQQQRSRVQLVTDTLALEADGVYLIPADANLESVDTHLRLSSLADRPHRAPVDSVFRAIATAPHPSEAIGVVLAGCGSDGTLGMRYIKENGGLSIAQRPSDPSVHIQDSGAVHDSVTVHDSAADLTLPLDRIFDAIRQFHATQPQLPQIQSGSSEPDDRTGAFARLVADLQGAVSFDLHPYSASTLLRGLRRRMRIHHVSTVDGYVALLKSLPGEIGSFVRDLLDGVVEFFHDSMMYTELERRIVPAILDRKTRNEDRVRAWSIGCSTGEEAYSLAMVLREEAERRRRNLSLQVFATELTSSALANARAGLYPREISDSVSPARLDRFFTPEASAFRVNRDLQDIAMFVPHDLFKDPPFSHIDLILCRRLLAKLKPDVRQGVLRLLHYTLESHGLLILGPGERIDLPELFESEVGVAGAYRKIDSNRRVPVLPTSVQPFRPVTRRASAAPGAPGRHGLKDTYLSAMEPYSVAAVLVDPDNTVVHFSTTAARYIRIPGGELTRDLLRLVPGSVRSQLREGLRIVREGADAWESGPVILEDGAEIRHFIVRIERVSGPELLLVGFDDRESTLARRNLRADNNSKIERLESEIRKLRDRLQALGDGDADGPTPEPVELRARVKIAAQELRSVLDELTAAKEELQTTTEELIALDTENRARLADLTQITTDLQHLLAATGIATLFLDRELRIVRFTPVMGELFSLRASDVGRPISDLSRLARQESLSADAAVVLQTFSALDREIRGVDDRWYLSRVLPYRTDADVVQGVVITLIDITARKSAEQAVQLANRQKDEFLAILGHELRNPLAAITSGVEVLKMAAGDAETVARVSRSMDRQTRQLVRLVDDLLEVSRITGGKLRLNLAVLDLRTVLEDALMSSRLAASKAGLTLYSQTADAPLTIRGDSARLTQIISNLLSNAIRYNREGGRITVTAFSDGPDAVLQVRDEGVGISREALEHIFEMFYQGRTGNGQAGLGIGLTLTKALVEMHGGSITATSPGEGQGSTFTVRIPLSRSVGVSPSHESADETMAPAGDHRILIVDDNSDAAESLSLLLKSMGEREVHTASSGAQALTAMSQLHPDIVLLDLMMPDMDGYEVARRLRSAPWGKDLFLVALSGLGQEEHHQLSREAGFDRHLTKPADLSVLKTVLRETRPAH